MAALRTIHVFIASPSDLAVERRAFKDVIDQLNQGFGDGEGVKCIPLGWEDKARDRRQTATSRLKKRRLEPMTAKRFAGGTIAFLLAVGLAGYGLYVWTMRPTVDADPSNPLQSYRAGTTNRIAIIFVHGVMGTATDTFTAVHSKAFWPELLRDDALFNDVDIYTFGYKSEWFSKGLTVKQLAQEMHIALSAAGIESRYEKLIFVCHSMGGLVTRSYMTSYPNEIRGKVSFLYFFGTPSSGSEIATVGRLIFPNSQLRDLAVRAGEPFLIDLQSQWLSAGYGRTIPAYCAYEARKMGLVFIVPAGRAAGLCNQSLIAIEANHVELVKPENLDDKPHLALRAAFQESVRAQSQNDVKLIPSNSVILSYDARSERLSFLFKVVVKSSRGAGDVIEEMYSTLQGPADDKRIPFSDGDHHCVRDDDEVERPFLFNASEITCVVSQQLGDLTREAISVGGDHRIVVTFETEDQRGHTLEYCFSLDQSDIDNLLKDSGRHQFRYAVCRV